MSTEKTLPEYDLYCVRLAEPRGGYWGPYELESEAREAIAIDPDEAENAMVVRCRRLYHDDLVHVATYAAWTSFREALDEGAHGQELPKDSETWRSDAGDYEVGDAIDFAASEDAFVGIVEAWAKSMIRFDHFEVHPMDLMAAKDAEFAEYRDERPVLARRLTDSENIRGCLAQPGDWLLDLGKGQSAVMVNEHFRARYRRVDHEEDTE